MAIYVCNGVNALGIFKLKFEYLKTYIMESLVSSRDVVSSSNWTFPVIDNFMLFTQIEF